MSPFKVGDQVTTDFYPKDAARVRTVIRVAVYPGHSQTGWQVTTMDGKGRRLSLDAGWYHHALLREK